MPVTPRLEELERREAVVFFQSGRYKGDYHGNHHYYYLDKLTIRHTQAAAPEKLLRSFMHVKIRK